MRMSQYFLPTLKENPAEAQIVSHRLMLRAGLVRQTSAGIYAWLPLGFRVLKNIERIVREEQDATGAHALAGVDVVFPVLHGPFGEDGTIQGLLEMTGTRYAGAGVFASAAGMDKEYMKLLMSARGLPVGPYVVVRDREWRSGSGSGPESGSGVAPAAVPSDRADCRSGLSRRWLARPAHRRLPSPGSGRRAAEAEAMRR